MDEEGLGAARSCSGPPVRATASHAAAPPRCEHSRALLLLEESGEAGGALPFPPASSCGACSQPACKPADQPACKSSRRSSNTGVVQTASQPWRRPIHTPPPHTLCNQTVLCAAHTSRCPVTPPSSQGHWRTEPAPL